MGYILGLVAVLTGGCVGGFLIAKKRYVETAVDGLGAAVNKAREGLNKLND